MSSSWPILSLVTFLPLVGALFCLVVQGPKEAVDRNCRSAALITSLVTFLISLLLWVRFDSTKAGFQFEEKLAWVPELNIGYHMGIDGISLFFVLLSTLLTPICILASWESVQTRVKEYMVAFLVLETFMVGMFCALDLALFYVFFEGVLIPMFLIIGVWGGKRRVYAAFKFFLYTLLGSVLMLLAIMAMYWQSGTTDITVLLKYNFPVSMQPWLWFAFFASFAVKMPMWPVHTWLPDAHVEAPTAGSVILAGVLLKMGGYGFIRLSVPMLPEATQYFAPLVFGLSIVAVIYTSLVALVQEDMKKLIAYSSVAHMGFVTIGIYVMNLQGVQGSIFQMLSHGIVSAALFLCVGVVYDRMHTRQIADYGGVVHRMPAFTAFAVLMAMANCGLPATSGFVGEFMVILAAVDYDFVIGILAATALILGAAYSLWMVKRVFFGAIHNAHVEELKDLNAREYFMMAVLTICVIGMGVYPKPFTDIIHPAVINLLQHVAVSKL